MIPILGINMPNMGMNNDAGRRRSPGSPVRSKRARVARTSIADALFNQTQQRVLRLLFGQPGRSFFANELIELTRSGSGAVQRELAGLTESGLVLVKPVGRQKHYQANSQAPIFEELCGIVLKTMGLVEPLRDALRRLESRIECAFVYGSVAKGGATAHSDIDLLIVSDSLTLEGVYSALSSVEKQLQRKISPTLYSSEEYERRLVSKNAFLTKVLSGPVIHLIQHEPPGG